MRATYPLLLAVIGCGGGSSRALPVSSGAAKTGCFERYAPITPDAHLECVSLTYPIVPLLVAAPGHIRAVFAFAVPGVPPAHAEDEGFFVVDLTPAGQQLVATGACPKGGDVEVQAIDAHGEYHVLCRRLEFPDPHCRPDPKNAHAAICDDTNVDDARAFVDDLRISAGHFTVTAPTLEIPNGHVVGLVLPDTPPAFVLYQPDAETSSGMPDRGPLHAMPWTPGAKPIDLAIPVHGDLPSALAEGADRAPAAILIAHGRLRLIVGWLGSGWDSVPPEGYDMIDVTSDGARDVGELHVAAVPPGGRSQPTTVVRDGALRIIVPLLVPDRDDEAVVGAAELDATRPAMGPTVIGSDADLRRAEDAGLLDEEGSRLSCDASGCVAATAGYGTFELHVQRWHH